MKRLLYFLLIGTGAIAAALAILLFGGLSIPLEFLDGRIETLATRLLQRPVTVHGPVRLRPSLTPALELGGVEIGNPQGWPEDRGHLLTVRRGQGELSLIELLQGKVRITDLEFSGVELTLVTRPDGATNFDFPRLPEAAETESSTSTPHEFSGLDRLSLSDLRLSYVDEASGNDYRFLIDEAYGHGRPGENLAFTLKGELLGRPCALDLDGGTLGDLFGSDGGWPVDGRLTVGTETLRVKGTFNWSRPDRAGYLAVALNGDSLAALGALGGVELPGFTDYSVAGNISLLPATVQVTGLKLDAAELSTPLSAELIVSLPGTRPQVAGTATLEELDLERLTAVFSAPQTADDLVAGGDGGAEPAAGSGTTPERPGQGDGTGDAGRTGISGIGGVDPLPWHLLSVIDSDLHLRVGKIHHNELLLSDVQAVLSLVDGDLVVPLAATLMDIPLEVQVEASDGERPALGLELTSPGGDYGPLLWSLTASQELQGSVGKLDLALKAQGSTLNELFTSAGIDLKLSDYQLARNGILLTAFKALALEYDLERLFSLTATGELLGQPLEVRSVIGNQPRGDRTVLADVEVNACGSNLQFHAERPAAQDSGTAISLAAQGVRMCGLMAPVENFFGHDAPFAVSADGQLTDTRIDIGISRLILGQLDLDGSLEVTGDGTGTPVIVAALHSGRIDLPVLLQTGMNEQGQLPPDAQEVDQAGQLLALARKILAWEMVPLHEYLTTDGRLELAVDELDTGQVTLADLKISALIEDGALKPSPFQARIGGNLFTGSGAVDTTGDKPVVAIALATDDFVLAELLKEFGIDQSPEVTVGHVGIQLDFPGSTVEEMLRQADYRFEVANGRWVVKRQAVEDLVLSVARLGYRVRPETAAVISMNGDVNGLPLTVEMTGDGLFEGQSGAPVALDIDAELAGTRLEVAGRLLRDKSRGYAMELQTELAGDRMNSLDRILGTQLPPFGPYRIGGVLVTGKEGIGLHDMIVMVGESRLKGRLDVSRAAGESAADTALLGVRGELSAETIQLNDFGLQNWSPFTGSREQPPDSEATTDSAGGGAEPVEPVTQQSDADKALPQLLSPELATMIDGALSVEVGEVLSGRDRLGGGSLRARVAQGRYLLDDLRLDIPGGAVRIEGDFQPGDNRSRASLRMEVKHFDYGIMARRVKPDANLKGEVNVDLDLNAEAAGPQELKRHLSGHLRFGVRPIEFEAGIIDLWASNIIIEALPALLKGEPSVVNCLAGDFSLHDGVMNPELFLLDSTKIRVMGTGSVDLKTDRIDFHLRPTPKTARFFSLATPITVSGSIYKPSISVTTAAVLKTVFRQLTSVVTVPLQWLFSDKLEADGRAACGAAMEWVNSSE